MSSFNEIEQRFENNIKDVYKLIEFDSLILNHTLNVLHDLDTKLRRLDIDNATLLPGNAIKNIKNIQSNKSLSPHYKTMYNQSIVLLVSLFASAVSDLLKEGVNQLALSAKEKHTQKAYIDSLKKTELKLTINEIIELGDRLHTKVGDIVVSKQDISFQDMKSINRTFRNFFGFNMNQNEVVNNIIMAQAARHVIVHDSSNVNDRIKKQVLKATPRDIKPDISTLKKINFSPDEIKKAGESMLTYFRLLHENIERSINS